MSNQVLNGGDLLVKCLLKEGITKIFGLVGGELLKIYDAIERWGREEGIDTIMVRHEQAGRTGSQSFDSSCCCCKC